MDDDDGSSSSSRLDYPTRKMKTERTKKLVEVVTFTTAEAAAK